MEYGSYCEKCDKETQWDLLVQIDAPDLKPEYDARDYCPDCASEAAKHPQPSTEVKYWAERLSK